jgi:hypothetical protein
MPMNAMTRKSGAADHYVDFISLEVVYKLKSVLKALPKI